VMVHADAFVLTYVWHLTFFFEQLHPKTIPEWASWSHARIKQPSGRAEASRAVRRADWVVFCQATPAALPSHVQRWAQRWLCKEAGVQTTLGLFTLTEDVGGPEGISEAFLRRLAHRAQTAFVNLRDCTCWALSVPAAESTYASRSRFKYE
jgi:hypothetical protein